MAAVHMFGIDRSERVEFYYGLAGQEISLPSRPEDRPSPEFLEWHADTKFVA
jgi:hypothetical protein